MLLLIPSAIIIVQQREMRHFCGKRRIAAALREHPRFGPDFKGYLYLAKMLFSVNLPVSTGGEPYATRSYYKAVLSPSVWRRQWNMVQMFIFEMVWVFSEERLRLVYSQQEGVPINRLRIRHLKFLLGRYRRLEAWRRRLRGMSAL